MGFFSTIGEATGFTANRGWSLASLDDPKVKFVGQFEVEELEENVGSQFGTEVTIGDQKVGIHFLQGDNETITFRARIFRTSAVKGAVFDALSNPVGTALGALSTFESGGDIDFASSGSVRDEIERLKSYSRATDKNGKPWKMGRPHRFILSIGTELEWQVFLKSPGGIKYDQVRSDGTVRGATFNMQLEKITPENLQLASSAGLSAAAMLKTAFGVATTVANAAGLQPFNPASVINIPGGSLHTTGKTVRVKQGMTFESIAREQYGNPVLGDVLRRAQPDKARLRPNDEIVLIQAAEIQQIRVTPQAVAFKDTRTNKALIEGYLRLRGGSASVIL